MGLVIHGNILPRRVYGKSADIALATQFSVHIKIRHLVLVDDSHVIPTSYRSVIRSYADRRTGGTFHDGDTVPRNVESHGRMSLSVEDLALTGICGI
jgi:hypothetical protein